MATPPWQLSRHGTLWILIGFAVAVAPLLRQLPPWLAAVGAVAMLWRIQIYRGRWGAPGRWLKLALVALAGAGLVLSFGGLAGLEPMVSLLVIAYALKLLEMHGRRDALVAIYLGFFVAVVQGLFDQGIVTALQVLAGVVAVSAGLAGVNQRDLHGRPGRPLASAAILVAQALPLMLVLFLLMPRLGPLWDVPTPGRSAITGMGDTVAPGDITRLSRSAGIAFRVRFEGEIPPRGQLYWRGLTLSQFDGRRWSRGPSGETARASGPAQRRDGGFSDYSVTLERTGTDWLYALAVPEPLSRGVGVKSDYTLVNPAPVHARMGYRARAWHAGAMDAAGLAPGIRAETMALPAGSNPRTVATARAWAREAPSPEALIDRVLQLFNRQFVYTLEPARLGRHGVDDFLWTTREGFCEHFASAFTLFMRAAGIPARVVVGYQGGEAHPEGYLIVRHYDAHAWAEVWLDGRGWVRVDPTAAVAPERIRMSLLDLFAAEDGLFADSPLSLVRFRDVGWINQLRLRMDAVEYAWGRWVLGYDDVQLDLLARLLGRVDAGRMALLLLAAGLLALAPVLAIALWPTRRHPRDGADRAYLRFCTRMARLGVARRPGEGVRDFAERAARARPELAASIRAISLCYEKSRYGRGGDQVRQLRRRVASLRG